MSGPIPHWLVSMHEITLLTTKQNAACEIGSGDIKRSRAPCDRDRIYYSHSHEVMDKLTKAVLHSIPSGSNTRLSGTRSPFHGKSILTNCGT